MERIDLRRQMTIKLVAATSALVVIGSVWLWQRKPTASADEARRAIVENPQGAFAPLRSESLKSIHLGEYLSDASANRRFALDPRITVGFKDRIVSHDFYSNGTLLEWNYTAEILQKSGESVVIQKVGHVRRHHDEWLEFKIKISCEPHTQSLSSGVVNRELQCQVSETTDPWKELKVSYGLCSVQPFGPRSRHVNVQYGSYQQLHRVTRESVTVDGDVVCGTDNLGMGRETQVSLYTNELPSVIDPAVGSRKQIFSLRTITTKTGTLVMRLRDEVVASTLPASFTPRAIHPRLAAIDKHHKSKFFKTSKSTRAAKAKRVARK